MNGAGTDGRGLDRPGGSGGGADAPIDVGSIVDRQRRYFRSGATRDRAFRLRQLETLRSAILSAERDLYAALWSDLHKGEFETYTSEIALLYQEIKHTRRHLRKWMRRRRVSTPIVHAPAKSHVLYRPLGVSAVLSPWNYPFQLAIAPVIASIAAGNCTIVKPSEFAPATAEVIRRMIAEHFDPAYLTCVIGDWSTAAELTGAAVDHIFFTGSTRVGRIVMKSAAERLIPVTLELGGKSPAIITPSAKLQVAARRLVWGKYLNAGQTCVAPDYVVVHRSVAEPFLEAVEAAVRSFFPDGPRESSDYGRIINAGHFDRLAALMDRQVGAAGAGSRADSGTDSGAAPDAASGPGGDGVPEKGPGRTDGTNEGTTSVVRLGGERRADEKFIAPTVYYPVQWDDPLMEDELFGPLLPVLTYDSLDVLFDRIAELPNPLAAYLFSEDQREKRRFEQEISFGGGAINDTVIHLVNPELPFGGCGPSGIGSYHGFAGFRAFSHEAGIMDRGTAVDIPLKYPPYGNALRLVRRLMGP